MYFFSAELEDYNLFYTDYKTVEISIRCAYLHFTTGMRNVAPIVLVYTRQRLSLLFADRKREIRRKVDLIFAPYCVSSQ